MKHGVEVVRRFLTRTADSRTSISDQKEYVSFCAAAASDDRLFATFRHTDPIVKTFEHVDEALGRRYLDVIRRDAPDYLEPPSLERIRRNDIAGSPRLYAFEETGLMSPVTLRYVKVLSDLRRLFGDLTGMSIVEIGVGYGGQCRLICEFWPLRSFTLIDLDPVLALADRYLNAVGVVPRPELLRHGVVRPARYDLVISNYAFTELDRRVQARYASEIVSHADRGYITCNFISSIFGVDSWSRGELENLHPGSHWLPEEPLTFEGNSILVWGGDNRPRVA